MSADARTRRRRWCRLVMVLAAVALRRTLPAGSTRARRLRVRAAADALVAVGVRVQVRAPAVAWPRGATGQLVVANRTGRLGELALLTALPGSVAADGAPVTAGAGTAARLRRGDTVLVYPEETTSGPARLGRFRSAPFRDAVDTDAPVCPVAVRCRAGDGTPAGWADRPSLLACLREAIAVRDLVVEVVLLPAFTPSGADPRTLAALSEYAVAEVLEAAAPVPQRATRRLPAPRSTSEPLPDGV